MASFFPAWPALQGRRGLFFSEPCLAQESSFSSTTRTFTFSARELFGGTGKVPPPVGNIYPHRYGQLLRDLGLPVDPDRVLTGVRVYRGQPVTGIGHERSLASHSTVKGLDGGGFRKWSYSHVR